MHSYKEKYENKQILKSSKKGISVILDIKLKSIIGKRRNSPSKFFLKVI